MISGGNIGGDTEEDDNLLTTSSFRNETPTCCIPQPQGIRIIGVISCVSGLFITCLTFLCMHLHGKDEEGLGKVDPTRYLLFTGLSSALVSIWLLCKEGSHTATKIWTLVHMLCAMVSIIMFSKLLAETNFDRLMQVLLSLAGLNLCIVIFSILVMIEFILHPSTPKDF
ncbi:uncharacterized protein LOC110863492 [Folsomia candida]|uniref:uncharacterized protein LOC110863492 n=1 Tax=Folsomia candida TaxID=158441 RepID=UPI000B8F4EDF|nr:uncharacterized protein LOC110863492 [Folsomia candida]